MPFKKTAINSLDNRDSGNSLENGALLPWPESPEESFLYYECTIGVMLDSGIVVHHRLPQINNAPDTLGSVDYGDASSSEEKVSGVNLRSVDQYKDIVQRMGHSRYWFRMWGQAIRVGYKVPIPHMKTIGGVPAVPYDRNPQWAYNRLAPGGNYGGVPMWIAAWSLWYTTISPPTNNNVPVSDPSALLTAGDFPGGIPILPKGIQVPLSQPDDNSKPSPNRIPGEVTTLPR